MDSNTSKIKFDKIDCKGLETQKTEKNRRSNTEIGDKPYLCGFPGCDKAYTRSDARKRHRQKHNNTTDTQVKQTPGRLRQGPPKKLDWSKDSEKNKTYLQSNQH